ncbi:hypothetical protein A5765_07400 [Mycolicibacterium celeriflavum]|uniref:hypothetical protein n=1 Tax=Mycolicibacterium celeriflavum TaxID=1249101 RepID=UPI0007FFEE6F|nr:hypothetical protein [Mycolicibacterium celeriflavum]OBG16547.1 hypothetical protein A5765_07400 [Mycolicibacterium celeriflavum]
MTGAAPRVDGNVLDGVSATTLWRIPGVRAARDIAMPPGRGLFKVLASPVWDRVGIMRRGRPSFTLLEFES